MLFNKARIDLVLHIHIVRKNFETGRYGRLDRRDHKFPQCPFHRGDGLFSRFLMHDQLADHRIVVGRDLIALIDVRIDPHARAARRNEFFDRAGTRRKIPRRIFGVDAAFDRDAGVVNILLPQRDILAGCDF